MIYVVKYEERVSEEAPFMKTRKMEGKLKRERREK